MLSACHRARLLCTGSLLLLGCLTKQPACAQQAVQQPEQDLELVRMQPDSLDENPGPALVLPLLAWSGARQELPADKGVIYGNCLQRLGFSSGGLGQYVRLVNLDTHKAFRLNVKPAFRSRRENPFCYALPPGRYALHSYEFSVSKWYGAELHMEPLRKHRNSPVLTRTRYVFEVTAGQLRYVGTWDFSQEFDPRFLDEKFTIDLEFTKAYPHLPLDKAPLTLPQ